MRIRLLAALFAACLAFRVHAGPAPLALSLDAAVEEAVDNSPDLRRTQSQLEASSWARLEAWSGYLPHLTLRGNQDVFQKYMYLDILFGGLKANFPEAFPSSTVSFNASQVLFDGFGAWHAIQAAGDNYDASRLDYETARFRLERQVRLRYYQARAAEDLSQVAAQNISTLESHLALARASETSGLGTRFDVLRIQARLEEARAEKNLADDNAVLARRSLATVLGRDADERPLQGDLPVPQAGLAGVSATAELSSVPDLRAARLRQQAAEKAALAAGAFWFPRISVFYQDEYYHYDSYDPAILASNGYQPDSTVGFDLEWPLFDGGASLARQMQAGKRADQAAAMVRGLELKLGDDLEMWRRRYLYNTELYAARLRSLEESQESVRLATLGLRAGTRTHTESLDAELDLFRARAGVVRSQMDAEEALLNLEMALGRPLQ